MFLIMKTWVCYIFFNPRCCVATTMLEKRILSHIVSKTIWKRKFQRNAEQFWWVFSPIYKLWTCLLYMLDITIIWKRDSLALMDNPFTFLVILMMKTSPGEIFVVVAFHPQLRLLAINKTCRVQKVTNYIHAHQMQRVSEALLSLCLEKLSFLRLGRDV